VVKELKTAVGVIRLLVNRVDGTELPGALAQAVEAQKLTLAGLIPADPAVGDLDARGEPIVNLPADAPSRRSLEAILTSLDGGV
jgi:CO dehydrogenase nickel-insertion accessory protein CooC1